jgi:CheY-like chemotaxis protein
VRVTVLVVDDSPSFRRTARAMLATRGFAVVGEATNCGEAVAAARELRPDAVLLDVHLPGVDGLAIAARLSSRVDAPRILLTSSDDEAVSQVLAKRAGAVGFVPKAELVAADLRRYLGETGEPSDCG